MQAFNPSTWEAEASRSEFEASLVYRVSSRITRATQRDPGSNKTKQFSVLRTRSFLPSSELPPLVLDTART